MGQEAWMVRKEHDSVLPLVYFVELLPPTLEFAQKRKNLYNNI